MKKLGIHLLLIWSFFFIMKKDALCKGMEKFEQSAIQEYIQYPEAARKDNLSDEVKLTFRVDKQGKMKIESVESEYEVFENAVTEQLSQRVFEQLDPSKLYKLVVHFKLL